MRCCRVWSLACLISGGAVHAASDPAGVTVEAVAHENEGIAKAKGVYQTTEIVVTLRDGNETRKTLSSVWSAAFPQVGPAAIERVEWVRRDDPPGNGAPHEFALWPAGFKFAAGSTTASPLVQFDLRTFTWLRNARRTDALRALRNCEFDKVDQIIKNFELVTDQAPTSTVGEWAVPRLLADGTLATTALHSVTREVIEAANSFQRQVNGTQRTALQELIGTWSESLRSRAYNVSEGIEASLLAAPQERPVWLARLNSSTRRFIEGAQVWNEAAVSYWLAPRLKRLGLPATDDKVYAAPELRKEGYLNGITELVECIQRPETNAELKRIFVQVQSRGRLQPDEASVVDNLLKYTGQGADLSLNTLEKGLDGLRKCYSTLPEPDR